jgi:hypothetical protein
VLPFWILKDSFGSMFILGVRRQQSCGVNHPYRFFAVLLARHRFFCAALIRARASADIVCFSFGGAVTAGISVPG